MRLMFLILFSSTCFGQGVQPRFASQHITYRHIHPTQFTYDQVIKNTKIKLSSLKQNNANTPEVKRYFLHQFEFQIFPHWVGTTWDYNGYANRPGKDKLIACGYFVSTPLKHMGFNWNRFKLA